MAVTMNDVARVAGVSLKTVSNVINNYEFIRPATKQRVLDAIDELGYEANLTARSLRSGKTSMIGLVLADLSIPYYAELASDIMKAAWARGYRVLVEQSGNGPGHEKAALQGQFRTLTDGLLFIPLTLDAEQIMDAAGKKPLVLLGEYVQDPRLDMVLIQNHRAAAAVTAHLLAGGRRRIAVLGAHDGDTTGSNGLRLEGYKAALADAGVAYDPALVIDCDWRRDGGAEGTARLLDSGVEFDAVFGLNDALALGALHELLVRGRKVPEEIAVAGFDDIDEAKFASPSLTTVAPGRAEIAERAVELLINRIENKEAPLHVQQPEAAFELRIRQSAP
ncbi:DNA-binding LacI/PurR family transcriptional regulator [Paenarthrobacter nicotinovorans]|uniref:LacI family DNA-binding transcriptional regulator n=1 Tax=Micrococcaceae TaxID=1268 RepID=UPI000876AC3E|nr:MULTISPECIES: LacI family DNA-binding transcriptional regulator [Micrococcaceae]MDR6437513.1 DNA-binding LacI/PurR family transcriptional regulator [Paenarthrobacter nicotinovorans]SCZ60585.1 transcriptional regulator, LacI family [Arthrobacter sp. UNCCL28]